MKLSVIVPVYNEEENIPIFIRRIVPILDQITPEFEIIFAFDPSTDRSEEVILSARSQDSRVKLLKFSRRVGQPIAILAGLQYSRGEAVIVIDVDLQDPPELIDEMYAKYCEGYDVVMAQRRTRSGETLTKKLVAKVGYRVINRISEVQIPPNTGEFRLMSRRVVDQINTMKESHGFLRGIVAYVGFNQTVIQFDRPPRHAGSGNYNRFTGSIRVGLNGVFCFSNYALSLCSIVGFCIAGIAFVLGFSYGVLKLAGFPFPVGIPTVVIVILFLSGVQLISTGILGEYLGRVYEEVRSRPRFIVERAEGFEPFPNQKSVGNATGTDTRIAE